MEPQRWSGDVQYTVTHIFRPVWTYQQNQQPSSSVFLSQQTSEQCFQHNKPAKRTGYLFTKSGKGKE
jgi:hypothetical protein